ncbi:hypothetical protein BGW80DRAFT_1306332 [Lactifluus volemus]|nr:hypothetical protein BGW80DRAFT_1306332 [Lactifluus volemus]
MSSILPPLLPLITVHSSFLLSPLSFPSSLNRGSFGYRCGLDVAPPKTLVTFSYLMPSPIAFTCKVPSMDTLVFKFFGCLPEMIIFYR